MKHQAWEKRVLSYRGRWAWPTPPLCPPCSRPRRCRSRHQLRSDDGSSGCGPHESHIWCKNRCSCIRCCQTDSLSATCVSWRHRQRRTEDGTKAGWGWGRDVLCHESGPVGESYLPLGRSPSSFLQRTVGTGSPRASHLNSTAWSTNTTWLPGRRTKLGRSAGKKSARKLKSTGVTTVVLD